MKKRAVLALLSIFLSLVVWLPVRAQTSTPSSIDFVLLFAQDGYALSSKPSFAWENVKGSPITGIQVDTAGVLTDTLGVVADTAALIDSLRIGNLPVRYWSWTVIDTATVVGYPNLKDVTIRRVEHGSTAYADTTLRMFRSVQQSTYTLLPKISCVFVKASDLKPKDTFFFAVMRRKYL